MAGGMEGSVDYARSYLKTDLRNTRTLLGLVEGGGDDWLPDLERLVHDLTVGLRESDLEDLDVDALRRSVEATAEAAARERRIADDTLRQWSRSFERLLPWWQALPEVETLLEDARWPAPTPTADSPVEVEITADERFRITRVQRAHDAVAAHFEKYVSKYPGVRTVRFIDAAGEVVATLSMLDDGVRWVL
jgi:hypothetical protein